MSRVFTEENGVYEIDCTKSVWATDQVHNSHYQAKIHVLKDADFVVETPDEILIIEYKNATISGAADPKAFKLLDDRRISDLARKFYGTLHCLTLWQKNGPKRYIYIVEAPDSDSVMRLRLKERLSRELPFQLQTQLNTGIRLIDGVEVFSIREWNEQYKDYPLVETRKDAAAHAPQSAEAVEDALCPAGS